MRGHLSHAGAFATPSGMPAGPMGIGQDLLVQPFWWPAAPLAAQSAVLPMRSDVVVVGSGYTGLSAALHLARAGRSVTVLEAGKVGQGASTRNGGVIGPAFLKPSVRMLEQRYGEACAVSLLKETQAAFDFLLHTIHEERIECNLEPRGRFRGALCQQHFEGMKREYARIKKVIGEDFAIVDGQDVHREVGTDQYVGGIVLPRIHLLDPHRYHAGLLSAALAAGVTVCEDTRLLSYRDEEAGLSLRTDRGTVGARHLVLATNGYTGGESPWLRRRLIPVKSWIVATEALSEATVKRIMPRNRSVSDTNSLLVYYRLSPDRKHLLFGGRPNYSDASARNAAKKLQSYFVRLFPELRTAGLTHCWEGAIAYTFDHMAHIGAQGQIRYAGGYCGAGIVLGTWFGYHTAQAVVTGQPSASAFEQLSSPTRPFYYGRPWFLPIVQAWYQGRDLFRL